MAETKLLLADLASDAKYVPSKYIRPVSDRPNLTEVNTSGEASIPLIDLQGLDGPNHDEIIKQIGQACQNMNNVLRIAKDFFRLPESERLKSYSDDPTKTTRLSTSFNLKTEKFSSWRDFLRLHCYPLEDYVNEWPTNPPSFGEYVAKYCTNVRGLALQLLEAISESL
ncbi:hypothetical protein UlMin_001644, partial [Ulmus minor]